MASGHDRPFEELGATIRPFGIEDYDAVFALWQQADGICLNSVDDSREGIARYLRRNPSSCFVAEAASNIVGAVLGGHNGRSGDIHHACVASEYQGRGIGTRLVEATLEALAAEDISHVVLHVYQNNKTGRAFWEKHGFGPFFELVYHSKNLIPIEWHDPDYLRSDYLTGESKETGETGERDQCEET
jgi:ribosomal protein S18 acetylase RimI-like enzyme